MRRRNPSARPCAGESGTPTAFIDPETFAQVQQVMDTHNVSGEKHWRHDNHLKGTVYCGYCGARLRFTQVRGNGGSYRYFMCGRRHKGNACRQPYLAATDVEEAVAQYYTRTITFDAERVADLEARLVEAFDLIRTYRDRQLAGERKLLARLQASAGAYSMHTWPEQCRSTSSLRSRLSSAPSSPPPSTRSTRPSATRRPPPTA